MNPSVEEILNMKSYQLKEFLEDHHVPVPKRQSKEFLQTVALQTHADREAESSKKQIITRRRSKREETTDHTSTYSGIYGRSSSMPRSSPPASRISPPPRSSITTRSRAQSYIKMEAESLDSRKAEEETPAIAPAHLEHDQEEGLSYSSYSALLHHPAMPSSPPPQILSSIDFNQEMDHAQGAATPYKQNHGELVHHEPADILNAKISMEAHQASVDTTDRQFEISKEMMKASDDRETNMKKQSRANQEVVKKIIRVNDKDAGHLHVQEKNKGKSGIKIKDSSHIMNVKGHHGIRDNGSRLQRLKRSGSMMMAQVNERVIKRLRKVPANCRLHLARPRPTHVSIALLMCAVCVAAIGTASYWYHLKKLQEQRARKRSWLW